MPLLACGLVVGFTALNLCGIRRGDALRPCQSRPARPLLAFVATLAPVVTGAVDWHRAVDFHLTTPFDGWFGSLTSLMAGLYLVGFAAPAFEAATCHVGETVDPVRNVPRAMLASGGMAADLLRGAAGRSGSARSAPTRSAVTSARRSARPSRRCSAPSASRPPWPS